MQVYAFGQNIGCDYDIVVVMPLFFVFGIKVGLDGFLKTLAVFGAHSQNVLAMQPFRQLGFKIFVSTLSGKITSLPSSLMAKRYHV
jgi:hypothetical protein